MSEPTTEPESAREKWNRRYTERAVEAFPDRPAAWLTENRELLIGSGNRRALDIACGDGRNALYLAELGFDVLAIDISDVAITALQAAIESLDRSSAGRRAINARQVDLEAEPLPVGPYDVILQLNYLQRSLFEPIAHALAPGGLVLVETVTRAHVDELGNDFDPRFVLEDNELLRSFPDLYVRHYREGVTERAGRPRGVASLVAERRVG